MKKDYRFVFVDVLIRVKALVCERKIRKVGAESQPKGSKII